ncbi:MAG: hypothetical protein ABUT20_14760 [Bacteroidota bacterium]
MKQEKAKIFLNEERGVDETPWHRSFHTFNSDRFYSEHKHPFGSLYAFNETTLAAERVIKVCVENDSFLMLLPVVGGIKFKDANGHSGLLQAGQVQFIYAPEEIVIELFNPYKHELVNFLQVLIKAKPGNCFFNSVISQFDLDENQDKLVAVTKHPCKASELPFHGAIGKFNGRTDVVYNLKDKNTGVFVYVIEGVFEVQNRLLHAKDGLALWNASSIEAEALSDDAILLVMELPY